MFILVPFSPSLVLLLLRHALHCYHWQMDPKGTGDWQTRCDAEHMCAHPYTQMQMIGRHDIRLWHPNGFLSPCLIGRVLPLFQTCALSLLGDNRQRLVGGKQMMQMLSLKCLHIVKGENFWEILVHVLSIFKSTNRNVKLIFF